VILVVAVVALAGCSGGSPGATTTGAAGTDASSEATPADGSEQALQTSDEAIESFSYPEGASPDGIEDLDTLLTEHSDALSGSSFTLNGSTTLSASTDAESDSAPINYIVEYDAADNEALTTLTGGERGTLTAYSDGSTKYFRIENESGTEYGTADPGDRIADTGPGNVTGEGVLRAILERGTFEATGVLTRDGTELVRYNLTELTTDQDIDVGERTFEGSLLIDSDGVIHEADISVSVESESGFTFADESHVEFTDIGNTTVEEPSWTSDAG
jgi:hypothetical protein